VSRSAIPDQKGSVTRGHAGEKKKPIQSGSKNTEKDRSRSSGRGVVASAHVTRVHAKAEMSNKIKKTRKRTGRRKKKIDEKIVMDGSVPTPTGA